MLMAPNKVAVVHNFSAGFEKTSDESFCQKTVEDSQKDAWRHLSAVKGVPNLGTGQSMLERKLMPITATTAQCQRFEHLVVFTSQHGWCIYGVCSTLNSPTCSYFILTP